MIVCDIKLCSEFLWPFHSIHLQDNIPPPHPHPLGSWLCTSELLIADTITNYPSGAAVEQWSCFNHVLHEDLGCASFPYNSSWSIHQGFGRKTQACLLTQMPDSRPGLGLGCPLWACADMAPHLVSMPSLGYFLHCLMDLPMTISWTDLTNMSSQLRESFTWRWLENFH